MSVSEFIDHWLNISGSDDGGADGRSLLYLKDWHFVKEYPDCVAYSTPIFFLDDWLNLYLDKYHMHDDPESCQERNEINCSDYCFVYMGAKGHIVGQPIYVAGNNGIFCVQVNITLCLTDVCKSKYPELRRRFGGNVLRNKMKSSLSQVVGTIKFIIWRIQYQSITTGSMPTTFLGCGICFLREYHEAKGYIEDIKDICDDFEGLCQRNLAAIAGMDSRDFFIFVICFALANFVLLYQLRSDKRLIKWNSSQMTRLLLFNLKNIKCITLKMKSVAAWESCAIAIINLTETIEDQSFVEFCNALGRTYNVMYNISEIDFSPNQILLEHKQLGLLNPFGSHICNPDELVTSVDNTFKLVGTEG